MKTFGLIGAAGFIAPRHAKAIYALGHRISWVIDVATSVGYLDEFDKNIILHHGHYSEEAVKSLPKVDYQVICTSNFRHLDHAMLALETSNVIVEKPLCFFPWELKGLKDKSLTTDHTIDTILQLRYDPEVIKLREHPELWKDRDIEITYHTPRGLWYDQTWKANKVLSGGLALNIGSHLFDLMVYLFEDPLHTKLYSATPKSILGATEFKQTHVMWNLSIVADNPPAREIRIKPEIYRLGKNFGDLHTVSYANILAHAGWKIDHVQAGLEFVNEIQELERDLEKSKEEQKSKA